MDTMDNKIVSLNEFRKRAKDDDVSILAHYLIELREDMNSKFEKLAEHIQSRPASYKTGHLP